MHALLCRQWNNNVKGRDWYDFLWYLGKKVPLDLNHLQERMIQSGHLSSLESWSKNCFEVFYQNRVNDVDFSKAKNDVQRFLVNPASTEIWSKGFFESQIENILYQEE